MFSIQPGGYTHTRVMKMSDANKVCEHPYRISYIQYLKGPLGSCYGWNGLIPLILIPAELAIDWYYSTPINWGNDKE